MAALLHKFDDIKINQNDIEGFNTFVFDALLVHQNDNQIALTEKLSATKSFRLFLSKIIEFEKLKSIEAQVKYIKLIDKLNDHIEHLEILTGQRTLESIERAGKRFAKKTQFPVGIIE